MTGKRSALIDPRSLKVRDNVPAGCEVSLTGLPVGLSFASLFRDELMARGLGIPRPEVRRGRQKLD